jgi:hypothetical protein
VKTQIAKANDQNLFIKFKVFNVQKVFNNDNNKKNIYQVFINDGVLFGSKPEKQSIPLQWLAIPHLMVKLKY